MGYKKVKKVCQHCGKEYLGSPKTKFCSRRCVSLAHRRIVTCTWCEKEFSLIKSQKRKFCSYSCMGFYNTCIKNNIVQIYPEKRRIEWSEGISYLIGIIASDGTLRKHRKTLRIASKDIDSLETISNIVCREITGRKNKIVKEVKVVGDKTYTTYSYNFTSPLFYDFCLNIGLMPNKSLILKSLEIPQVYFSHFLRGLIDGDGNFNVLTRQKRNSKVNHIHIRIYSGSPAFLNWINNMCFKYYNINRGSIVKSKNDDTNTYVLFWSNKFAVSTLIKELYKDSNFYLNRKKEKVYKAVFENEHVFA